jgi:hypothetical protein
MPVFVYSVSFDYETSTNGDCPRCGCAVAGLVQTFVAPCDASFDDRGRTIEVGDNGTNTQILWDSTTVPTLPSGEPIVQCENGHYVIVTGSVQA